MKICGTPSDILARCVRNTNLQPYFHTNLIEIGLCMILNRQTFFLSTALKQSLRPTHHPIQWVPGLISPGVKRLEPEVGHSPLSSSAGVKSGGAIFPLSLLLHGTALNKLSTGKIVPLCLSVDIPVY